MIVVVIEDMRGVMVGIPNMDFRRFLMQIFLDPLLIVLTATKLVSTRAI
jgi:hypothetical protein